MDPITYDELIAEINRLGIKNTTESKAVTVKELMDHWGKTDRTVRNMLREANALGILRTTKKNLQSIDGRNFPVPAYYFEMPKQARESEVVSKPATRRKRKSNK